MKVYAHSDDGKYRIECLTKATLPGAIQVIREAFFQDEAVCIGAEVNINPKAGEELEELCADAALDGVSLVAVHTQSGIVAAAAFNKIQTPTDNQEDITFFERFAAEHCMHASAKSLIRFMDTVDSECDLFEKYSVDCSLEIMFLATLTEHRQKNLARLLCLSSIQLAKDLRQGHVSTFTVEHLGGLYPNLKERSVIKNKYPKICSAILTSAVSQKLAKSLNFVTDLEVSYKRFFHNGKTYADRIGPASPFCALVSKKLY